MAIQFNDSGIVLYSGLVAANAACCACVGACLTNCTSCADTMTVTISGLTGVCAGGNGNYAISKIAESCVWEYHGATAGGVDCLDQIDIMLSCTTGNWVMWAEMPSWDDCLCNTVIISDGRAGACPPTGAYVMGYVNAIDQCCNIPTVSLAL